MAKQVGSDVLVGVLKLVDQLREDSTVQGRILEHLQSDIAQLREANARTQDNLAQLSTVLRDSLINIGEAYDALEKRVAALETRER